MKKKNEKKVGKNTQTKAFLPASDVTKGAFLKPLAKAPPKEGKEQNSVVHPNEYTTVIEPVQKENFTKEDVFSKTEVELKSIFNKPKQVEGTEAICELEIQKKYKTDFEDSEIAIEQTKENIEEQAQTEILPFFKKRAANQAVFYGRKRTKTPFLILFAILNLIKLWIPGNSDEAEDRNLFTNLFRRIGRLFNRNRQ